MPATAAILKSLECDGDQESNGDDVSRGIISKMLITVNYTRRNVA